jgi:hypothetical protein
MAISQREARLLKKRVYELERQLDYLRGRWSSDWGSGWVHIGTLSLSAVEYAQLEVSRALKHAVVLLPESNGTRARMYADAIPKER